MAIIISIEGIDACGKDTQAALLRAELLKNKNGLFVSEILREPGGTVVGEAIRNVVLNNETESLTKLFLFEASRVEFVKELKSYMKYFPNGIFILNRYFDSTTAYQGSDDELDQDFIRICNKYAAGEVIPSLTIYLRIDYKTMVERKVDTNYDFIESKGEDYYTDVIDIYDNISKGQRWVTVDGTKSIEEIHTEIMKVVEKHIANFNHNE